MPPWHRTASFMARHKIRDRDDKKAHTQVTESVVHCSSCISSVKPLISTLMREPRGWVIHCLLGRSALRRHTYEKGSVIKPSFRRNFAVLGSKSNFWRSENLAGLLTFVQEAAGDTRLVQGLRKEVRAWHCRSKQQRLSFGFLLHLATVPLFLWPRSGVFPPCFLAALELFFADLPCFSVRHSITTFSHYCAPASRIGQFLVLLLIVPRSIRGLLPSSSQFQPLVRRLSHKRYTSHRTATRQHLLRQESRAHEHLGNTTTTSFWRLIILNARRV